MSAKYKILSFDGGGIRGVIPSIWLSYMENKCLEGKLLHNYVDMVAGTSTGSLIACGVAAGIGKKTGSSLILRSSVLSINDPGFFQSYDSILNHFNQAKSRDMNISEVGRFFEQSDKSLTIFSFIKDPISPAAAVHKMIPCSGILYAEWSAHEINYASNTPLCQDET